MPALQVKDFPDGLYERLRLVASRNHRSIAQQTIAAVEDCISKGAANTSSFRRSDAAENIARRRKVVEKIKARPPLEVPDGFPAPQEIIREMRDSR